MRRNLIGRAAIEAKSKSLDIPMERLFAGYVLEQLALQLSASGRGNCLLLKNPDVLGLRKDGKGSSYRLEYAYLLKPQEMFKKADFAQFLKTTIKWERETNIEWSWRSRMEEGRLVVELSALLDEMRLPVGLAVTPLDKTVLTHPPREYTLRLVMENNKTGTLLLYPAQEMLFDDLGEVFAKLEFIGDMGAFARIYETLGVCGFEGRQFQKKLVQFCEEKGLAMDEARFAQLDSYLAYPYLIKKWKGYLKKRRKSGPTWEEVYGRFWNFLRPLWKAKLEGLVYLGSWIPDLGRYLD